MDTAEALRHARRNAGLTQSELAVRTGTSQATISAYERSSKQPSVETLGRLLEATGSRLAIVPRRDRVRRPSGREHARTARGLLDVLALAEALPTRHDPGAPLSAPPGVPARSALTLADRLVALHQALAAADVPHAFGGAIALAYWTLDPRATGDIDLNLFVPADGARGALEALPAGVTKPDGTDQAVAREGQVRLWWDETPLDLFFDYAPIHGEAARHVRTVPFADARIPVLGPVELAVFKALFDRTRDWADLEAMMAAGTLDVEALRASLGAMLDGGDARFARLDEAVGRASSGDAG